MEELIGYESEDNSFEVEEHEISQEKNLGSKEKTINYKNIIYKEEKPMK